MFPRQDKEAQSVSKNAAQLGEVAFVSIVNDKSRLHQPHITRQWRVVGLTGQSLLGLRAREVCGLR